ncbi:MAG: family 20 glycosylhydrolase [Sphingomonadales bacterium]|nr:family 20 glycosylhydrolase [Sphingomonadales bacterium]
MPTSSDTSSGRGAFVAAPGRLRRRWLAAFTALLAIGGAIASPTHARSSASPLALDWRVTSVTLDAGTHRPRSHARLTLTNTGKAPLAPGWTLWFTEIADAATADPAWPVRQATGGLYAITGIAALAPGASVTIPVDHPGEIVRDDKGPTAPYLVPAGGKAIAIARFTRRGPRADTPGVPAARFTDPAAAFVANLAWQSAPATGLSPILPEPAHWQVASDAAFAARLAPPTCGHCGPEELAFARRLAGKHGLLFHLAIAPGPGSPEAYRLDITRGRGVRLAATSPAGLYYGLQTLRQLLFRARATGGLHATTIVDTPRYPWRGLLLDPARNFLPLPRVIAVMDLMATFKLNRLHLHLSDDEGWRLAIAAMPELTGIAGHRGHGAPLPPAHGSGPGASDPHGSGFYTEAQYIALLRAAQARHIEVLPEFDLPGHARAAIIAMRASGHRLDDPADSSSYRSPQGYTDNAVNPAMPGAQAFVATLASELCRIHAAAGVPLHTFHLGGDEVPAGVWTRSPAAAGAAKAALWTRFFDRAFTTLGAQNLTPMGWEEMVLTPGTAAINPALAGRGAIAQVWNDFPGSEGLAARLANAGFGVVMSPTHAVYLDLAQAPDPTEPGHDWAGLVPLQTTWAFDPEAEATRGEPLTPTGRANLLGLEATLFSETVRAPWRIDHMLMPRLLAVAERGWSAPPDPATGWPRFSRRLGETTLPFVEHAFPTLRYRLSAPGVLAANGAIQANYPWPGVTLRYTTNGTAPTPHSPAITAPLPPGPRYTIAAFTPAGRTSPATTVETGR